MGAPGLEIVKVSTCEMHVALTNLIQKSKAEGLEAAWGRHVAGNTLISISIC